MSEDRTLGPDEYIQIKVSDFVELTTKQDRNLQDYVLEHMDFDIKFNMLKQPRDFQHIMYLLVCLGGEVGETQNVFKKFVRDGKLDWDHFAEEMVDVFVYLCMLFGYSELNFEEHYQKKMKELHRRWEERNAGKV